MSSADAVSFAGEPYQVTGEGTGSKNKTEQVDGGKEFFSNPWVGNGTVCGGHFLGYLLVVAPN